jgi:hypothetical protein
MQKDNGIGQQTPIKLQLGVIISLIVLVAGLASAWARVELHVGDESAHHTDRDLDQRYMNREATQARLDEVMRILARIEGELDQRDGTR